MFEHELLREGGGLSVGSQERVDADAAAGVLPLVVLLGQHSSDESPDGAAVGEHAADVGPPADLLVESLLGLFDQIWRQCSLGKPVKARMSAAASARWQAAAGAPRRSQCQVQETSGLEGALLGASVHDGNRGERTLTRQPGC